MKTDKNLKHVSACYCDIFIHIYKISSHKSAIFIDFFSYFVNHITYNIHPQNGCHFWQGKYLHYTILYKTAIAISSIHSSFDT